MKTIKEHEAIKMAVSRLCENKYTEEELRDIFTTMKSAGILEEAADIDFIIDVAIICKEIDNHTVKNIA